MYEDGPALGPSTTQLHDAKALITGGSCAAKGEEPGGSGRGSGGSALVDSDGEAGFVVGLSYGAGAADGGIAAGGVAAGASLTGVGLLVIGAGLVAYGFYQWTQNC